MSYSVLPNPGSKGLPSAARVLESLLSEQTRTERNSLIYICIPAYNEASTIGLLLWKIRQVMSEFPRDYELLVIDDASSDDTEEVLAPYARVLPLTVIRNEERLGYASSLERVIREAVRRSTHPKRDVVVTLQGDFTEAPGDIPLLIKRIEGGADVVEAVAGAGSGVPRAQRWSRRGLPLLLRNAPLPEGIRDPLSGFRAYRVGVLKRAITERNGSPLLSRQGWAANVELLLAVAPHSRRADAMDVDQRFELRQRESRFSPWTTLVDLWNLSRIARRLPEASES
jgi:glycosyltransferase involved in cell wall biosynthesis